MRFFTNGTWRPRARAIEQIPTPVGESCLACGRPIQGGDCGVSMVHTGGEHDARAEYRPWHLACFQSSLGAEAARA